MKQSNRGEVLVLVAMLVFVGLALYFVQPAMLKIRPLSESEVLALITTLFVLAVFVERANESILIPIRTPDKQKIELELDGLRALPTNDLVAANIRELEADLSRYRLGTAKRAYWISLWLGILISIVGVRIIGELVVVAEGLQFYQSKLLSFVDIVVTGAVISGGSAAIDKIGRRISGAYNLKSVVNQSSSSTAG